MKIDPALHRDFLGPVEATLGVLEDVYPQARLASVRLFERPGDRSLAHVEGHSIVLNAYWFAEPSRKLAAAALAGRQSLPYGMPLWHGGMSDEEGTHLLTHEFGHLVAAGTEGSVVFAKAAHAAVVADPVLAVSGYAIVDPDEWWGETFAALRLGAAASPQVAEMEAFLGQT